MASIKEIMKTARTIGMAVLTVIVCSLMAACSSDDDEDESGNVNSAIVGTWYATADGDYTEWIFNSDGSCGWKEYTTDKKTVSWYDTGTYKLVDNILSIWWESERRYWDEGPWSTVVTINGKTMTTAENRSIVWKKK